MVEESKDGPDGVVEQVVERAATKVAEAVGGSPAANGTAVLSRAESLALVAVLIILNISTLFLALQNKNIANDNKDRIQQICKVIAVSLPASGEKANELTPIIAECLG